MGKPVLQVVQTIFFRGGTNVPVSIKVTLDDTVDASDEREAPDVKLASLVQKRVVDVLLYDESRFLAIFVTEATSN